MEDLDPIGFARAWIDAWNARDVDAVLAHFHENAEFSSPVALRLGHGTAGRVCGKEALRRYWTDALSRNPHLRFELEAVHVGTDVIVICFSNQDAVRRAEVLVFEGRRVISGRGTMQAELH